MMSLKKENCPGKDSSVESVAQVTITVEASKMQISEALTQATARFKLGISLFREGDITGAIQMRNNVINIPLSGDEIDIVKLESEYNLGIGYTKNKEIDKAIQAYEHVFASLLGGKKAQILRAKAKFNLGIIYEDTSNKEQAREAYKQVITLSSKSQEVQKIIEMAEHNLSQLTSHGGDFFLISK